MSVQQGRAGPREDPVLALVRSGRARTRSELIAQSGLSRSTVSNRVDRFLADGLLLAVGGVFPTRGRPASLLRFNGAAGIVIAVDLGASHLRVAVVDLDRKILAERVESWPIANGPDDTFEQLEAMARGLVQDLGLSFGEVIGMGVGIPGPVEFASGEPVSPPIMPGWHRYPVRRRLSDLFGVPVWVDNDVNVSALGEWSRNWRSSTEFLFVKAATGIGAGIVSNGEVTRGAQGCAGDIGHIPIEGRRDVMCACGNLGCLEAVAGGVAVAAKLARAGITARTAADVVEHVRLGVPAAVGATREAGRFIGQVVAGVVNTLNPDVIVVGGTLADAGDSLLAGVREVIYQRCPPLATNDLKIVSAALGGHAAIDGATALVLAGTLGFAP